MSMFDTNKRIEAIRECAWNGLLGKDPDFNAKGAVQELETIGLPQDPQAVPIFWEAKVLAVLSAAKKARRAQKPLYRLFKIRLANKQGIEFFTFQNKLNEAKEQGVSLEGLHFFDSFAHMNHDDIWADTRSAIDAVKNLIGPAFLNSGTLLGSVREKGLIAHDDDVDIAVFLKATNAIEAADAWLDVYMTLLKAGMLRRPPKRNFGVFKMKSTTGVNIDVFPAWIEDGDVYVYPHTFGALPKSAVLPLGTCQTTGLPIPNNPELMLVENYGEGWALPDPGFTFPWMSANRKFAAFLARMDEHKETILGAEAA